MKQVIGLALALGLSSCGFIAFPTPVDLSVISVSLPATVAAGEPMTVSVRYGVGCGDYDQRLVQIARTATRLVLGATAQNKQSPPGTACPAVYIEKTLDYIDPGTPTRTGPFEVVVNGKNWGTVQVQTALTGTSGR